MNTITHELTTEQQSAVDQAVEAIEDNVLFKIGGYAGTGKTTVAKYIVEALPGCMPCAFTGKAAYRLRQKGLPAAQTIHRTIYQFGERVKKELRFTLKPDVEGDWFLIDEGSMIPTKVWGDLLTFGKPILLLGDPGQLEPVGVDPKLMHKADVVLEQIHRQAEGNGIIEFATDIRLGISPIKSVYGGDVRVLTDDVPRVHDLKWADIIICAFNRTRIRINKKFRAVKGYTGLLCKGEKIIILKNNPHHGVFNGQILTVELVRPKGDRVTEACCKTDDGETVTLPLLNAQFGNKPITNHLDQQTVLADYGYCITTHKSQGSEWDKVVVIDEQCPRLWNSRRWRYTAITRAAKELRFFCGKGKL